MVNTKNKGDRREREAKKILEEAGYKVHKSVNNAYDSSDMFGWFDLIAIHEEKENKWVQVKSNSSSGAFKKLEGSEEYINGSVEVWIIYDRLGWRIVELPDKKTLVDERESGNKMGADVKAQI